MMNRTMIANMLSACALVTLLAQALTASGAGLFSNPGPIYPGNDAFALCSNQRVDLTSFTQLLDLQKRAMSTGTCSGTTERALTDLTQAIGHARHDLCSAQSIELMARFYAHYLDTSREARRELANSEELPRPLRRFALAYGLQMANACKRNMIRVLTQEREELLTEGDAELLEAFASDKGPLAEMLGDLAGPGEVFLPSDLAPFLKSSGLRTMKLGAEKIYIQTKTGPHIRQLQALCARRFEPIYGPLMLPLVRLANLGFNYKDQPLKGDLKSAEVAHNVAPWSRIVFMCEALKGIHIVVEPEDQAAAVAKEQDDRLVRIITEEEARAIEARSGKKPLEAGAEVQDEELEFHEIETAAGYEPHQRIQLDDVIYDKDNASLMKAVSKFKTYKSEKDIIKKRLLRRGFSMVGREIKQGHAWLLMSAGYKGILQRIRRDKVPDTREELVKTLDDLVRQDQANLDKPLPHGLGDAKTFVISVALVAIAVGLGAAFLIGSAMWIG